MPMKIFITVIITLLLLLGNTAFAQNPALDSLKNIKDPKELDNRLRSLFTGSERDMLLLLVYYQNSAKSADSVIQSAVKRFPKGKIAFTARYAKAVTEKNPVVQEQLVKILKEDFPDLEVEQMYIMLSYSYANAKNAVKALGYLGQTSGSSRSSNAGKVLLIIMNYDVASAAAFAEKELKKENSSKEDRLSLLDAYAQILMKKGNFQKAFIAIKECYDQTSRMTPALTANYYYLLSKTGRYRAAFPELERIVANGLGSKELKDELKRSYAILYPEKNVDEYVAGLNKELENKWKKEVSGRMIKVPSPNFTVRDVKGKAVSLADFKGKTIVLDFWATWCVPCKRSLPAMQMAVDKYKNDDNVKFLFIHTLEDVPNPKNAALKYFRENNFRLPLFMDLRDPNTKMCPAVTAFNVQGIPAKFVIDGQGNIRFKVNGFGGANENAVAELSAMIDLINKL